MKILFVGDYSNLHATLARELRRMGHQADVLSDGCEHMNVHSDFYLKRDPGIIGGFKYLYNLFELLPKLKGYDVVQIINTNFLNLRPPKIKYFYQRLKEQNHSMFMSIAGTDYFYAKACYDGKLFRFNEFKEGNKFTKGHLEDPGHLFGWMANQNRYLSEFIYSDITGAMAVLPEYHMVSKEILGDKVAFTNLPIDFSELPRIEDDHNENKDKIKLFVGIRTIAETFKGTKYLSGLAKEIENEIPELVTTEIVRDLTFRDYLDKMKDADIVLDQLYAYSPAMNALYGMSLGKAVGTGAQPEYYEYLGNPEIKPLIALSPLDTDLKERLIDLIKDRDKIKLMGQQSRNLALTHNASPIVAKRYLDHWNKLLG